MKSLKKLAPAMAALTALMAVTAGPVSATTLEIGGVAQNSSTTITMSLESGTSTSWILTNGSLGNSCSSSNWHGNTTSPFSGSSVSGLVSTLSFTSCVNSPVVVDAAGTFNVERIGSTTNATVRSAGTQVTVPTAFFTMTCVTGSGTDIGTLTGVKAGSATLDVNAVLNCGFLAPSVVWQGSYAVTGPMGLGITG